MEPTENRFVVAYPAELWGSSFLIFVIVRVAGVRPIRRVRRLGQMCPVIANPIIFGDLLTIGEMGA